MSSLKSWACSTVSGATAVSRPAPSAATSPMARRASTQAAKHEQAAGERGGEAPELEDALLADGTGRQDGGAHDLKHEEGVLEILLALDHKIHLQLLVEGDSKGKAWREVKGGRRGDAEQDSGYPERSCGVRGASSR